MHGLRLALPALLAVGFGASLSFSALKAAEPEGLPATIPANDSIFVDGKTFTVVHGKARGDVSDQIKALGARDLGPGAVIFRSGD